ncbi:MAG: hypothetical protein J1E99_01075 [Muribaculaceae bacterium]|nr:hypothetical protein [Muribaculaceae bacterium]
MKALRYLTLLILPLTACGGGDKNGQNTGNLADQSSGNMVTYENSAVNGVTQALPTIMLLPADGTLQNFGALDTKSINGRSYQIRDYQKYLNADDRFRRIASTVQSSFNQDNYPLQDFEQTLKQLDTRSATDMADDLAQDAKTLLLQTANPDIVLELNYYLLGEKNKKATLTRSSNKKDQEKVVSYTLSAIDAYTNKVIATVSESNLKGGSSTTEMIQNSLVQHLPALKQDIVKYFSDLQTRGREVTLRVTVAKGSNQNLSDESIEGDTYADYIMDYVKTHTVKGAYKMQTNTKNELYFVNVRIPMVSEDGTQYGVYDWTRELTRAMRKDLGVKVSNQSQGLGEIALTIDGFPN